MQSSSVDDRRIDFRISVDLVLNKYIGGRPYLCRASNLSRCGLLLHRVFEPENDLERVGLQFQLPGSDRVITCAGRVAFELPDGGGTGVEFTNVDPEHQTMIDDFILSSLDWASI
ncbi:MAG: PilZ domain-containing protein [Myxococcales bacterium]|nr:PilZ domain-containing protein [Myxococcales bacterium]